MGGGQRMLLPRPPGAHGPPQHPTETHMSPEPAPGACMRVLMTSSGVTTSAEMTDAELLAHSRAPSSLHSPPEDDSIGAVEPMLG
jgi:hypothetical protein